MLNIALIGTGNMGRKYARMIQDELVRDLKLSCAVCRSEASYAWGKTLDGVELFRSSEELFAHADLFDAVLIATPHLSHYELAMEAFSLRKHVLCEKPASPFVREAFAMAEAAEKNHLVYGIVLQHRCRPVYRKLKAMIEAKELGRIHRIQMVNTRYFRTEAYHNSSSWRSTIEGEGGGALMNQGQHPLDLWQWLFGLPETVQAMVMYGKYNDFDVEDEATILMRYEDGCTGSFFLSTAEGSSEESLFVSGSHRSVRVEGNRMTVETFSEDTDVYRKRVSCHSRQELETSRETIEFEDTDGRELYVEILQNFTDAVLHGEALIAPGSAGVGGVLLTDGAYESEASGKYVYLRNIK